MKPFEIIEQLKIIHDEHGDLPSYVWADHGQTIDTVYSVTVEYIDENNELIHPDDMADHDESELIKIILFG